jgi:hypothetical protein
MRMTVVEGRGKMLGTWGRWDVGTGGVVWWLVEISGKGWVLNI